MTNNVEWNDKEENYSDQSEIGKGFDIYLPFVGVFDLKAITRKTPIESLRYEMVYVTKLLEIHERRVCKEMLKGVSVR